MPAAQVQTSLTLFGSPPWGFHVSGGKDVNQPLVVGRITPGSLAERSGVKPGDVLIAVNNQYVSEMTADECDAIGKEATGSLHLVLIKGAATVNELPGGQVEVHGDRSIYTSRKDTQQRIAKFNRSARPFGAPDPPPAKVEEKPQQSQESGFRSVAFKPRTQPDSATRGEPDGTTSQIHNLMAGRIPMHVVLNNGVKCPLLGFGTYLAHGDDAYNAVRKAIDVGYRHIDTAFGYENERDVGRAINEKISERVITREDIFVVSKLSGANHKRDIVVPALKRTLENLNLSYLDMFLIHAPWSTKPAVEGEVCLDSKLDDNGKAIFDDVDPVETWHEMEECVKLGLSHCIGISNFNRKQTEDILNSCTIKPVTNQVELHHFLNQEKLRSFSEKHGIVLTAYRSLGGAKNISKFMGDERILKLAKSYNKTSAQIIIRWIIQRGIIALPKSTSSKRIEENFCVFDFEISAEDMKFLSSLNSDTRYCQFVDARNAKYFPFGDGVEY